MCVHYLLQTPMGTYPDPCSLRYSSLRQPLIQPWPGLFSCFTGAPPAACHALSHMRAFLSGLCPFWTGHFKRVQFCTSYCSSCKNAQTLQSGHCPIWLCSRKATNSCDLNRAMRREKGRGRGAQQARATAETRTGFKATTIPSYKGRETKL